MPASNYVHLDDVTIIRATDLAFLIEWDGGQYWLPRSQVADPDDYSEGDVCNLSITEWIAREKGIEVE